MEGEEEKQEEGGPLVRDMTSISETIINFCNLSFSFKKVDPVPQQKTKSKPGKPMAKDRRR